MLFLVLLILCYLFSAIVYTEELFNLLQLLLELNIHIAIYIGSLTITKRKEEKCLCIGFRIELSFSV